MQRHAEGHGNLWQKQAIVLNEAHHQHQQKLQKHYKQQEQQKQHQQNHQQRSAYEIISDANKQEQQQQPLQKTDSTAGMVLLSTSSSTLTTATDTTLLTTASSVALSDSMDAVANAPTTITIATTIPMSITTSDVNGKLTDEQQVAITNLIEPTPLTTNTTATMATSGVRNSYNANSNNHCNSSKKIITTATKQAANLTIKAETANNLSSISSSITKPNDWVVIPVFADIVKLALAGREECLQRLPNGHINIKTFDRMAAIVGAFTKHMNHVKATTESPVGEYEIFCRHMQKTSKLNESELMMASFDCEEPNNAEKLMYDLN